MTQYTNPATYYNAIAAMSAEISQLKKGQFNINRKLNELSNHHDDKLIVRQFCFGGDYSEQTITAKDTSSSIMATVYIPKNGVQTDVASDSQTIIGYVLQDAKTLTMQSLSFKVEQVGNALGKLEGVPASNYILNDIKNPMIISNIPSKAVFYITTGINSIIDTTRILDNTSNVMSIANIDSDVNLDTSFTIGDNTVVVQETTKMAILGTGNQTVRVLREVTLPEIGLPDVVITEDSSYDEAHGSWRSTYQPLKVYGNDYYISTDFTTNAVARNETGVLTQAAGYIMKPLIGDGIQYVRTAVFGGPYTAPGAKWYPPSSA